jgi:hypothetical protein
MSSKYFLPYCIRPIFLQDTEAQAKKCGLINGLVYAVLASIIIITAGGRYYFKEDNTIIKKNIYYGIIIGLSLVWLIIPFLCWYGNGNIWKGYDSTISELIKQGYTRPQALAFLNGMNSESAIGFVQGLTTVFAKDQKNVNKNN